MSALTDFLSSGTKSVIVTSSGSVSVPSWAKTVSVSLCGGGSGGGGTSTSYAAGGGGGMAIIGMLLPINGAPSISVTVGSGGAGANTQTAAGNGGDTSITLNSLTITAKGATHSTGATTGATGGGSTEVAGRAYEKGRLTSA